MDLPEELLTLISNNIGIVHGRPLLLVNKNFSEVAERLQTEQREINKAPYWDLRLHIELNRFLTSIFEELGPQCLTNAVIRYIIRRLNTIPLRKCIIRTQQDYMGFSCMGVSTINPFHFIQICPYQKSTFASLATFVYQ